MDFLKCMHRVAQHHTTFLKMSLMCMVENDKYALMHVGTLFIPAMEARPACMGPNTFY